MSVRGGRRAGRDGSHRTLPSPPTPPGRAPPALPGAAVYLVPTLYLVRFTTSLCTRCCAVPVHEGVERSLAGSPGRSEVGGGGGVRATRAPIGFPCPQRPRPRPPRRRPYQGVYQVAEPSHHTQKDVPPWRETRAGGGEWGGRRVKHARTQTPFRAVWDRSCKTQDARRRAVPPRQPVRCHPAALIAGNAMRGRERGGPRVQWRVGPASGLPPRPSSAPRSSGGAPKKGRDNTQQEADVDVCVTA